MRKLVVLGLAALVVLAALLPTIYSITARNTAGGRVFKYTAIMGLQKEPEDDPWTTNGHGLFVGAGSTDTGVADISLSTSAGSFSSSSVTISAAAAPGPEPWVSYVRIVSTFSYASTTTAEVRLVWSAADGGHPRMYIPSRTYSAGVTYRWFVQINMYNTSTLKVMPILPVSSRRLYYNVPLAATCSFTGGASQTGLSLSISRATQNATHVRWTTTITFTGSEWNNRHVTVCTVQVNDSSVVNNLNSFLGTSFSTFWILQVAPGITVIQGDSIVVEVWIVAPANI